MSEEAPKLRLRPKLTVDTPAAPAAPVAAAVPPTAAAPSELSPAMPAAPASEPTSIRLKPRVSLEPTAPAPAPPPSAPPSAAFAAVVAAPPPVASAAAASLPVSDASLQSDPGSPTAAVDYATRAKKVQRVALLILGAGVVVFAVVGYFAFPRLIQRHQDENSAAARLEDLIRKAREKNQSDEASPAASPEPATASTPSSAPPATQHAAPAPTPASVATKATAPAAPLPPPAETLAPGEASAAFRGWVQNLKITGVRTGAAPKISFGSASYNAGEIVNHDLGIRFEGHDAARRMLIFKDAHGATVERRH